jgi:hypothetical protein
MFDFDLDDFNFNTSPDSFGCCSICYKAKTVEPEYMKIFLSSKEICEILNGSFKGVVNYINKETKLGLEQHALSAQFQLNMNNKYNGTSPSQKDVQEFGSSVRRLQKEYSGVGI